MDYVEEIMKFIRSHHSGDFNFVPDITAQKVIFYPNPVKDNIYFNTTSGILSIYDISGKQVFSQQFTSGQTDLSFLKQGIYIIKIQSGNEFQVSRLIKR